ncbi:MAG: S-layer homology domain-containing protein, partial [Clostridia bacterium]|nr:S-layer homology domain-containing protein [Clostridia bacterium]
MKKTMALLLVFCVMFSTLVPVTIAGAEEEMEQTRVILSEDFESAILEDKIYNDENNNGVFDEEENFNSNNDIGGFNGWGESGNKNPQKPYENNRTVVVAKMYEDEGNKAASFIYKAPGSATSNLYYAYEANKTTTERVSTGLVIFKMRAKPTADAGYLNINLRDGNATAAPYISFDAKAQRISSSPGIVDTGSGKPVAAIQADVWTDYEIWIDYNSKKARIFIGGEEIPNTKTSFTTTATNDLSYISRLSIGLHRYQGAWATDAGWSVDDIQILAVADLDARMAPTDDGDLYKAKLTFNNSPVDGIDAANIKIDVDGTEYTAESIEAVEGDDKSFIVTFPTELAPGFVEYPVTLNGFTDKYGSTLTDKTVTHTTRAKRYEISDPIFYTGYGTDEELDIFSFGSNGTFTVEYKIKNELADELDADIILVHKRGDEIVKAVAADANVAGETRDNLVTATVEVADYTAADKLEAYIWDSVTGMEAYKPVFTINSSAIESESDFVKESAITDLKMNAAVDFAKESMVLSGSTDSVCEVAALVFDPGYKLSDLTVENFDAAVSSIVQKATDAEGNYSFACKISAPQDGKEYSAATGADGKTVTDSALFFVMTTVNNAVSTTSSATAAQLMDLLAGKTQLAGNIPLNDVLQMDMSVYDTLTHKNEVCEALAETAVTDVDSIRTAFANIVATQRAKEDRINALLKRINDALWSEIEAILEEDLEGENDLDLPWEDSYADIEDDEDMLTDFYKRLASDYTFETYLELQEVFEDEAKSIYDGDDDISYGGGGGGGGSIGGKGKGKFGYSSDMTSVNQLTPIVEEKEEVKRITDFSDIGHVAWAQESIKALAEEGIIAGVGGDKFAPDAKVTREQFIKMIVLAFDLYDAKAKTDKFIDVPSGMWYTSYVASAVELGLVYGVDDEHFGVGKEITRAEMATILTRAAEAAGKEIPAGSALNYADNAQIPAYASDSISKLTKAGIMSGVGDNMFAPYDKATRAMAAKVI